MKEYQVTVSLPKEFESFEQLEMLIQQQGQKVKQQLLQQVIAEMTDKQKESEKAPPICPDCQKKTIRRGSKARKLKTIFGDVWIKIGRCHCKGCAKDFLVENGLLSSLAKEIIPQGNVTKSLRRVATLCGASWPYEQAEKALFELTGAQLSHNQIKNLCANQAEDVRQWTDPLDQNSASDADEQEVVVLPVTERSQTDRQYIGIDGVFINERAKKRRIEAKVAIRFTDKTARVSANRNLLLDKHYLGTFQNVKVFRHRLIDHAQKKSAFEAKELILLGDGAPWIRKLAAIDYPKATLILDWWHLKKRVKEAIREAKRFGLPEHETQKYKQDLVSHLWLGEVLMAQRCLFRLCDSLIQRIQRGQTHRSKLRDLPALNRYITNNSASIVNYQKFSEAGYFISSVFVEKANEILVCRRQKLRAMNWSRDGAEAIILLRQLIINNQWDRFWRHAP